MQGSEYLVSDLIWYDQLENVADGEGRFSTARLDPPAGWTRSQFDGWVSWVPDGAKMPAQGWKIHVSACLSEADEVIDIVRDYCLSRELPFKFLRSEMIYLVRNEKYASRAASGKLCALYPADDATLEQALRDLSAALAGRAGPYILSDLRWGPGPLFVRYGGFLLQHCVSPERGEFVPAIREPGGDLVPDLRMPVFRTPAWAPVPELVADQMAAVAARLGGKLPYRIEEALHFSNGGGIYRGSDPATGRAVVLREARPHAGLDAARTDAVCRIERERAALERLAGLDCVPELIDYFTCWEHHFLVQEFIEGEVLQRAIVQRYPLIYPDPTARELADYVQWAMTTLSAIERAVEAVHSRGLVFGDLHPFNIIVRSDGRVALVDFEESSDLSEQRRSGLGAAGFMPPWQLCGAATDEYALNCLRLAFFLPLTSMLSLDPDRVSELARVAARRFGLPASFRDRLIAGFASPASWDERQWRARRPGLGRQAGSARTPGGLASATPQDRREWLPSMARAILASATPERPDRLFPGDPRQFAEAGISIAHGAAGVLYALAATGGPVLPEHVDWLARAALRSKAPLPGAYGGLDGTAAILATLGRAEEGLEIISRTREVRRQVRRVGLYDGLAGIGLALLHLSASTGERALAQEAASLGEALAAAVRGAGRPDLLAPASAGLVDGWTGVAAFLLALHDVTGESSCLRAARAALRLDLDRCAPTRTGGLQIEEGFRILLYLATGSAGIGLVIRALDARERCPDLAAAVPQIRIDFAAELVAYPGLFEGRSGILYAGSVLAPEATGRYPDGTPGASLAEHHLGRLGWHALCYQGHLAFPGDRVQRISMDLATGTAGVLLAAHAAMNGGRTALPLLGSLIVEACLAGSQSRRPGGSATLSERNGEEVTT